jgi:hypothetical protein
MDITKEEFDSWKLDDVTKAFFAAAKERVEDCKDVLAGTAGQDSIYDSYLRGFIAAYREMFAFRLEE